MGRACIQVEEISFFFFFFKVRIGSLLAMCRLPEVVGTTEAISDFTVKGLVGIHVFIHSNG